MSFRSLRAACVLPLALAACGRLPGDLIAKDHARADQWMPLWGDLATAKLRPGRQTSQNDGFCTASFLFVDPVAATYYLGTAGHCVGGRDLAGEGNLDGTGTRVRLEEADFGEVGTVVFDSDSPALQQQFGVEDRVDFALVELDPGINLIAHPQVVSLEAPTGFVDCAATANGDRFAFHGYGAGFGRAEQTRTREGVLTYCDGDVYGGYTPSVFGDSGGAVVHLPTGAALGQISGSEINQIPPQSLNGAIIPYILRELHKAGFGNVALATIDGGYVGLGE